MRNPANEGAAMNDWIERKTATNERTLRCCRNYAAHLRYSTMKITLKAPNGKRQVVRGPHLERALRMQGWTDADTEEQKQRAKVKVKRNGERRAA